MSGPRTGGKADLLIVGEAPGKVEDQKGEPFVGPAGMLMRALLSGAGFDLDTVAWCNTVSCWPNREPPTPNVTEMAACRANLRDQVVASGATYVVLAGGTATSAWRSDLRVSDVHGQVFLWGQTWVVMPIWHPAAILRDPTKKQPTISDLSEYHRVVVENRPLDALGVGCIRCHEHVNHYDPDGVPYCQRHWNHFGNSWVKEWKRWDNPKGKGARKLRVIEGQGELLGDSAALPEGDVSSRERNQSQRHPSQGILRASGPEPSESKDRPDEE